MNNRGALAMLAAWLLAAAAPAASNVFTRPYYIYKDFNLRDNHGVPSGWMGDYRDLMLDMNWTNNPQSGASCIRFSYTAAGSRYADMAGVMWQNPANNMGDIDGGVDLTGATQLVFWADHDPVEAGLDDVHDRPFRVRPDLHLQLLRLGRGAVQQPGRVHHLSRRDPAGVAEAKARDVP